MADNFREKSEASERAEESLRVNKAFLKIKLRASAFFILGGLMLFIFGMVQVELLTRQRKVLLSFLSLSDCCCQQDLLCTRSVSTEASKDTGRMKKAKEFKSEDE